MKGRLSLNVVRGQQLLAGPCQGTVLEGSRELSFCAFFFFLLLLFEVEILVVTFEDLFRFLLLIQAVPCE